jgi:hypothetical protein
MNLKFEGGFRRSWNGLRMSGKTWSIEDRGVLFKLRMGD